MSRCSWRLIEITHLMRFWFQLDLSRSSPLPAGHLGKRIFATRLLCVELGILRGSGDTRGRGSNDRLECVHGGFGSVALVRWDVRFVEVLVLARSWLVATTAAITTAFEARKAAAATRLCATSASDDTDEDTKKDQASHNHDGNDWVPGCSCQSHLETHSVSRDLLAKAGSHAIVPTGQSSLHIRNFVLSPLYDISLSHFVGHTSDETILQLFPSTRLEAPRHSHVDRRHLFNSDRPATVAQKKSEVFCVNAARVWSAQRIVVLSVREPSIKERSGRSVRLWKRWHKARRASRGG